MDRRTFCLLTGAATAPRSLPRLRPASGRPRAAGPGRLSLELDDRRRWSLWYRGDGVRVPVLGPSVLRVRLGDQAVALGDLQDITDTSVPGPAGATRIVRGRAAGVVIQVALAAGGEADRPRAEIAVTVYPDVAQPVVRGVDFLAAAADRLLPGAGDLVALENGFESWSACRIVALPVAAGGAPFDSHGAAGFTRGPADGPTGLALAFDGSDPGTGEVRAGAEGIEAATTWTPPRPVAPGGDTSRLRFAYAPDGDAMAALDALFARAPDDVPARFAVVPAGWCSWYQLFAGVTEDDVVAHVAFAARHFDPRHFRVIQLDDGYERAAGDWDVNGKFPHGHRWLTDRIHSQGLLAGLWIAPFAASEGSGLPAAHPDWLASANGAPVAVQEHNAAWGGRVYALDGAHAGVQTFLRALGTRIVRDWGYDYVKADFLLYAFTGDRHAGGATHAEAFRAGLAALRDGMGPEPFLLGCGAPLQHAAGLVNGARIGTDVDASWDGLWGPARAAARRSFYQRGPWLNDPDCLVVRAPLTADEARTWAATVALSGGLTLFSDNLLDLPDDRVALLQRTVPVAPAAGRPLDAVAPEREVAPAVVDGDTVIPIPGPWHFRTGDDPGYAGQDYDASVWETVPVPSRWEDQGHADYDGYAWYRTRFTLPVRPAGGAPSVTLALGKLDDADETWVNGAAVGATGAFPPAYASAWNRYRSYAVPADRLNWGGDNVLAIRVYDGGGPGGYWSVRRDAPPATWAVTPAPGWWIVAHTNWDDAAARVALDFAALGLGRGRFDAYDVWSDAPLGTAAGTLATTLAPHATLLVALRAEAAHPQVIGSTRHLVQGAIDIRDEAWDTARGALRARSVNLDARPYAVTIATPRGWRATRCSADQPCRLRAVPGAAVLEWPAGTAGADVAWEVRFTRRATSGR